MSERVDGRRPCGGGGSWLAIVVSLGLLCASWSTPAAAAECLARSAVSRDGATVKERVLAPDKEVATYESLGFSREQCELTVEEARQAVERVCKASVSMPTQSKEQFAQRRGVSFSQLCQSGRDAVAEMASPK